MILYTLTIDELKKVPDIKGTLEYIKNNALHVKTIVVLFQDQQKRQIPISIHIFASINQDLSDRIHFTYIENDKKEPFFVGYGPYTSIRNLLEEKWQPIMVKSSKFFDRLRDGYLSGKIKCIGIA